MTPAIHAAKRAKIAYDIHEYEHDPSAESYGLEAAEKLGLDPARVFKTLVVAAGADLVVAVLPVACQLNLKRLAKAVGVKKAAMAEVGRVERATGYVVGGVSPSAKRNGSPRSSTNRRAGWRPCLSAPGVADWKSSYPRTTWLS